MRWTLLTLALLGACSPTTAADPLAETDAVGATTEAQDATSIAPGSDASGDLPAVTFHRDVRPLIERHCDACHTPDNIAPFSLQTYAEVFALRESIANVVQAGTMPPWGLDSACGDFVGDPSLDPAQRDVLAQWVEQGAPEGDPADFVALEPIALPALSRTDLTLQVPEPYTPTQMPDEYRCFVLDWPETTTTFVTGFQFEPDNTSMSHHAIAYIVAPQDVASFETLDAEDPGPGYTCFGGPTGGGTLDFIASRWLGAWAPGSRVGDLPAGTGLRIEPGAKIILQMHYNTLASDGQPDQSRMHYRIDAAVEREAVMLPWADPTWIGGGMPIPAGSPDTVHAFALDPTSVIDVLSDALPADVPLEIFSAMHHMHKRGSQGAHAILRADGTTECLLSVPRYDFDWQHEYRLAQSVIINPGDQLQVQCQWDNGDNAQAINWGDGTDDEMCLGLYYITVAP